MKCKSTCTTRARARLYSARWTPQTLRFYFLSEREKKRLRVESSLRVSSFSLFRYWSGGITRSCSNVNWDPPTYANKKKRLRSKKEKKRARRRWNFNSHTHTYTQTHQDTESEQLSESWIHGPKPIRTSRPWNRYQNFIIKRMSPRTRAKKFRSSKIGPSQTGVKYFRKRANRLGSLIAQTLYNTTFSGLIKVLAVIFSDNFCNIDMDYYPW